MSITTPVQYLKNVGPKRAALLHKMGLYSVGDLLEYYPRRYEDRRLIKKISHLQPNQLETTKGRIETIEELKVKKNFVIIKAWIKDDTGSIPAVWFNQPFVKKQLERGREIIVHGKVENKYLYPEIIVQDYEIIEKEDTLTGARIVPIYAATEKLPQKIIRKILFSCVEHYASLVKEVLPSSLLDRHKLMDKPSAIRGIHFPESMEEQRLSRYRLAFEELFLLQLGILTGGQRDKKKGISHRKDKNMLAAFEKMLPFQLTAAQERVIDEVFRDMEASAPMARLVQGDVGSGKTVVAAAALYKSAISGYQGAMMAPTEILADQHYQSLSFLLGKLGIEVACLTGSIPLKDREILHEKIRKGDIKVVVGTHALIQEGVFFKNLSLAVTDEQHRFGVMQREEFQRKGFYPDVLVMTATPIPRSLALTLYGDLDLSVIDEMPPGRKEIKTYAVGYEMEKRIFSFIRKEINQGRQVYIVCPLIEESERMDLEAAVLLAERLEREEFKGLNIALLHGKMKPREKDEVMDKFRQGMIDVIVSTTVIEVGINVPNASIMLIRDAERFGLAQLHQLRGRVGRGEFQSYCILMHQARTKEGLKRMKIMETTNDGFKIAEADLEIRGPGDFFGTRQHGLPELKIANIFEDAALLEVVRQEAQAILSDDPYLNALTNQQLKNMVKEKFQILN